MVVHLGDEAGAAVSGGVDPQPAERNHQPIAQSDQEIDMRETPRPPSQPAAKLEPAEIDDRVSPTDGGEIACMPVAKRSRSEIGAQPPT